MEMKLNIVPEGTTYKVDPAGRAIIPSYLRKKFGIAPGDHLDYFTAYENGEWWLVLRKAQDQPKEGE